MGKCVKTSIFESNEVFELDSDGESVFKHPSKYYIINSLGQYVYYHCRDRALAQSACDEEYGSGKYKIRTSKQSGSSSGEYSARGSNSRKGFASHLKKTI